MKTTRSPKQEIVEAAASWDGVDAGPHRFGATEFCLDGKEFGHVHPGGVLDIPFPRALRDALVAEGWTGVHHVVADSGWTTFRARTAEDVPHAVRLLRLSYLYRTITAGRDLAARRAEVERLDLPASVHALFDDAIDRRTAPTPAPPGFRPRTA